MLETARSQIAGTVSQAEVQSLPLNGRNFLDVALLVPGVSPPNIGSTQLFAETSAVPGVGLSVGSQRNFSNSFIVDGLSANDDAAGLSGMPYGVDAVEQFQVVTSGGQAELGPRARRLRQRRHPQRHQPAARRPSTATSATTRSTRATRCRARRCRCRRSSTAAASAVRFARDRTFFFANVEQRLLDQTGSHDDQRRQRRRRSTRGWRPSAIPARRSPPASIRNPVDSLQRARQGRSRSSAAAISSASATASTTSPPTTRAAPAA